MKKRNQKTVIHLYFMLEGISREQKWTVLQMPFLLFRKDIKDM